MNHPVVIQGGMGAGVSDWRLARTVSQAGQLGVVSGTALNNILPRRLQMGDPGGHMRRAMEQFPAPEIVRRVLDKYYIPDGKAANKPFKAVPMFTIDPPDELLELTILSNFVEVYLAKEGHDGLVGINYLEKIQMPHLSSLYGALLADVDYVIMGAGIPREIPGALDALSQHQPFSLKLHIDEAAGEEYELRFDPRRLVSLDEPLKRPFFLPIVASVVLALSLARKANGRVDGFVVEGPTAGGHNAPPRGPMVLDEDGEPVYGPKDDVEIDKIQKIGLPFWMAGSYADPGKVREVLEVGGSGVQVGTAFALCDESGLDNQFKNAIREQLSRGEVGVFTDPLASPTGFPFKVFPLAGSLTDAEVYQERPRICDLGYLQMPFKQANGEVGYRCASEPLRAYTDKGGKVEATRGRKCLCNALLANIGLYQVRGGTYLEKPLVTTGNDIDVIRCFFKDGSTSYSAVDVIDYLLDRR